MNPQQLAVNLQLAKQQQPRITLPQTNAELAQNINQAVSQQNKQVGQKYNATYKVLPDGLNATAIDKKRLFNIQPPKDWPVQGKKEDGYRFMNYQNTANPVDAAMSDAIAHATRFAIGKPLSKYAAMFAPTKDVPAKEAALNRNWLPNVSSISGFAPNHKIQPNDIEKLVTAMARHETAANVSVAPYEALRRAVK